MNYFDYVVKTVESGLNDELDATEQVNRPFRIYPDIGDYIPSCLLYTSEAETVR